MISKVIKFEEGTKKINIEEAARFWTEFYNEASIEMNRHYETEEKLRKCENI